MGVKILCLIRKAQAAASVGLTGLSLDFAKTRELDDPAQLQGKWASANARMSEFHLRSR